MNTLLQDLKFSLRLLAKTPGFTLTPVFFLTAMAACYLSARVATRVSPLKALRSE